MAGFMGGPGMGGAGQASPGMVRPANYVPVNQPGPGNMSALSALGPQAGAPPSPSATPSAGQPQFNAGGESLGGSPHFNAAGRNYPQMLAQQLGSNARTAIGQMGAPTQLNGAVPPTPQGMPMPPPNAAPGGPGGVY